MSRDTHYCPIAETEYVSCDGFCTNCYRYKEYKIEEHQDDNYIIYDRKENIIFQGSGIKCKKFIADTAHEFNYGVYRMWICEGKNYYDCGPVTYHTDKILETFEEHVEVIK